MALNTTPMTQQDYESNVLKRHNVTAMFCPKGHNPISPKYPFWLSVGDPDGPTASKLGGPLSPLPDPDDAAGIFVGNHERKVCCSQCHDADGSFTFLVPDADSPDPDLGSNE